MILNIVNYIVIFIIAIIALNYFILWFIAFIREKGLFTKNEMVFKPISNLVYTIITGFFIIMFISHTNNFSKLMFTYVQDDFTNLSTNHEFFIYIVVVPFLLLFTAIVANFSRSVYIVEKLDSGTYFSNNYNDLKSKKIEMFLRSVIIFIFIFCEFLFGNIISSMNKENLVFERYSLDIIKPFSSFFLNIDFKPFEAVFWFSFFIFLLYSLILIWNWIVSKILTTKVKGILILYFGGIFISSLLIIYSLLINNNILDFRLAIVTLSALMFIASIFMISFIFYDIAKSFSIIKIFIKNDLQQFFNRNK